MNFEIYSPIETVTTRFLSDANIHLDIKRDDMIHPFISGNKWRKLKYNIQAFQESTKSGILTYGGAYSNHLIATAAACARFKIPCIGVVRGDELTANSNIILRLCKEFGMNLRFVSRSDYNLKDYIEEGYFTVPEGGGNGLGAKGCEEIMTGIIGYDHVVIAVGTATTFKGVINGANGVGHIHGIAALKNADYLKPEIEQETSHPNWTLHTYYSGDGFGKYREEDVRFNAEFASETGVLLDPIYTGKAMRGLYALVKEKVIKPHERILFIHTGGLTGILSDKWLKLAVT